MDIEYQPVMPRYLNNAVLSSDIAIESVRHYEIFSLVLFMLVVFVGVAKNLPNQMRKTTLW